MTREEREDAIIFFEEVAKKDAIYAHYSKLAIEALQQEPCEDAIRRDELLKAMDTWDKFGYTETGCFVREPKNDYVKYIHYDDVIKCIKGMPSVTPQQMTGHWIDGVCSECGWDAGQEAFSEDANFCMKCGVKMLPIGAEKENVE